MLSEAVDFKKAVKAGSFQQMGLEKELLQALSRMKYTQPTPVQRKTLPIVLSGLDVVCMARTGSGKTCVFLLPMVQKLKTHSPSGTYIIYVHMRILIHIRIHLYTHNDYYLHLF
ncbi:DEAD/DEAH box helicase [archaeon]|nr:MAG: DEAD/DEAH box helicase [archaeon]